MKNRSCEPCQNIMVFLMLAPVPGCSFFLFISLLHNCTYILNKSTILFPFLHHEVHSSQLVSYSPSEREFGTDVKVYSSFFASLQACIAYPMKKKSLHHVFSLLSWGRKANHLAWNGRCWYPLQNSVQNHSRSYWLFAGCWNLPNLGLRG